MVRRFTLPLLPCKIIPFHVLETLQRIDHSYILDAYHSGENKHSYKYQINAKTIDPHQITILRILLIPKNNNPHEITDVTDIADFYRLQDHCRWCVGVGVWVLCGVACVGLCWVVRVCVYVYLYVYVSH